MGSRILGVAAGLAAAAAASAAEPAKDYDVAADWLKRPAYQDMVNAWILHPSTAREGTVVLDCTVTVTGALADCAIGSEKPIGGGFGAAALSLTPRMLFRPATKDGKPVPQPVHIPVNFVTEDGRPPHGPMRLSNIEWLAAPGYAELAAAYPEKAGAAGAGGRAVLGCEFAASGKLQNCKVIREAPSGQGFGKAALGLADQFAGPATLVGGESVLGALTEVNFTFDPKILKGERAVATPAWTRLPSQAETAALLAKQPLSGDLQAKVECTVGADGGLTDCRVESETPTGQGFGAVALGLASYMRLSIWTEAGLPSIGGRIVAPFNFHGTGEKPAP